MLPNFVQRINLNTEIKSFIKRNIEQLHKRVKKQLEVVQLDILITSDDKSLTDKITTKIDSCKCAS